MAAYQQNLAVSYTDCFQMLGNLVDLESAFKCDLAAVAAAPVAAAPVGHPNLAVYQQSLGMSYSDYFERLGNLDYLESALKYFHIAIAAIPIGHPNLAGCQQNLALSYAHKFQTLGNIDDLHCALFYFHASTQSQTANPQVLMASAKKWADLANENNLPECMDAYSSAISTLPNLLWMGNALSVHHEALLQHDIAVLTVEGAAACIEFDNYELAVELLEQGLDTTYQQLLQLRDEFTELERYHFNLAKKLKQVSLQLQNWATQSFSTSKENLSMNNHHEVAIQRVKLIRKIRNLPQFEHFLMPQVYQQLCLAAEHGPVVMINCTDSQSDAIMLLSPKRPIYHVAFPDVSLQAAGEQLQILKDAITEASQLDQHCSSDQAKAQQVNVQRILQGVVS